MLFRRKSQLRRQSPYSLDPGGGRQRRGWKLFFLGLVVLLVGSISWVVVSGLIAFKNISANNAGDQSSFFRNNGEISPDQLLKEGDSRINILSLGIDKAAGLTDSIQVISIDPINKSVAMLSVPRDLYVTNSAEQRRTKINEVYNSGIKSCASKKNSCDEGVDAGGELMKKTVAEALSLPIHYFTRINFEGVKKIVDTLGGVQVYVDKALNDPKFPNSNNNGFEPFRVSAGLQRMNGDTALKYARSRQTTSDFDRARRQQQVISAIREKALTPNVLTNPKKVTDLISVVGRNFKTDLQSSELYAVARLIQGIDSAKTVSKVLDNGPDGPLRSTINDDGQYILVPTLGQNDWTEVRDFALGAMPEPYLIKESARIKIVDASGKTGLGETLKKKLTLLGYSIVGVEKSGSLQKSASITYSTDKPYTLALLKRRFNLTLSKSKSPSSTEEIIFTLGSNFALKPER